AFAIAVRERHTLSRRIFLPAQRTIHPLKKILRVQVNLFHYLTKYEQNSSILLNDCALWMTDFEGCRERWVT
ncbi:MAG: hypothetical protein ABJA70_18445, partial [Chryseolinea sp.]